MSAYKASLQSDTLNFQLMLIALEHSTDATQLVSESLVSDDINNNFETQVALNLTLKKLNELKRVLRVILELDI